jgi:hypothetical protein
MPASRQIVTKANGAVESAENRGAAISKAYKSQMATN